MKKFVLNKIEITSASLSEIEESFKEMLFQSGKSNLILTYNIDFLRNAEKFPAFKDVSKNANLILPDGIGITSLLKLKYGQNIERITGSNIFLVLLKIAEINKLKVSFLGSSQAVVNKLKIKINKDFPGILISTAISPPFNFEKSEEINCRIISEIKSSSPDILFAAFGSPRQELWLYKNMNEIGAKINIGVGAVFDFYTGEKKRAPKFFQKAGAEWLWRLVSEPKRLFKRYVINDIPFFISQLIKAIKK